MFDSVRPSVVTVLLSAFVSLAHAQKEGLHVRGLGVCVPGSLDPITRRPLIIPTLASLNGFPLGDFLEARYNLPTSLHVDVDAALLGEQRFGAGKGFRRLLFLTVNAVVGASLFIDGQLEHSAQQYVGHISHMLVSSNGPRCSCGKRGCINTLISIDAMQKMVQRALRRGEVRQGALPGPAGGRPRGGTQDVRDRRLPGLPPDRQRPDRDGPRTNPGNHRVWRQYQREPDGKPRYRVRHVGGSKWHD